MTPNAQQNSQEASPLLGWLFCGALFWRLCVFGSSENTIDPLASCLFAAFACYFTIRHAPRLLDSPILKWWALYGLFLLMLWPLWPHTYQQVLYFPALFCPIFIAFAFFAAPTHVQNRITPLLLGVGSLHGIASIWQSFFEFPQLLAQQEALALTKAQIFRLEQGRTLGLSASPDLSALICITAIFAGLALFHSTAHKHRPIILLGTVLALCGLGLSRSTGGFLACLIGLATAGFYSHKKRVALKIPWAPVILLLVPLLLLGFRGLKALQTSSHERLLNWQGVLHIIENNFFLGVGPGGFPGAYELWRPMGSNLTRYAHSLPLQITAEMGLVGLCLILFLYGYLFKEVFTSQENKAGPAYPWLLGGLIGVWAHALVDYGFQNAQTASMLALMSLLPTLQIQAQKKTNSAAPKAGPALLISLSVMVLLGSLFLTQRKALLLQSAEFGNSDAPLTTWVADHPADHEALMALMAQVFRKRQNCQGDCAPWIKKSRHLSRLWAQNDAEVATGWLLAAQIAHANGEWERAKEWVDKALSYHPGMPQAWKFKLASFSHDPNYPTWYHEASKWLHGRYRLKGLPKPQGKELRSP